MNTLLLVAGNEIMALLTLSVVFGGFLPPRDGMEWFMLFMLMIPLSFVWWVYVLVAPIAFMALYLLGDWKPIELISHWPWNHIFGAK